MSENGLGSYSAVQVLTIAKGLREINSYLAMGWTLLSCQVVEEIHSAGGPNKPRKSAWVPMGTLGRSFSANEDADLTREQATDAGEDALAMPHLSVSPLEEASEDTPAAIPETFFTLPTPKPPLASRPRQGGKVAPRGQREVAQSGSLGKTQTHGIRGG